MTAADWSLAGDKPVRMTDAEEICDRVGTTPTHLMLHHGMERPIRSSDLWRALDDHMGKDC